MQQRLLNLSINFNLLHRAGWVGMCHSFSSASLSFSRSQSCARGFEPIEQRAQVLHSSPSPFRVVAQKVAYIYEKWWEVTNSSSFLTSPSSPWKMWQYFPPNVYSSVVRIQATVSCWISRATTRCVRYWPYASTARWREIAARTFAIDRFLHEYSGICR